MRVLNFSECRTATIFAPVGGANVEAVTPEGEVLAEIGFTSGIHRLDSLLQYFPETTEFRTEAAVRTRMSARQAVFRPAGRTESGANPDFKPQRMTEGEARLKRITDQLERKVNALEKRDRATAKVKAERVKAEPNRAPKEADKADKAEAPKETSEPAEAAAE